MRKIQIKPAITFTGLIMMMFCTLYLVSLFAIAFVNGILTENYQILFLMNEQGEANVEILFVGFIALISSYAFIDTITKTTTVKQLATIIKGH